MPDHAAFLKGMNLGRRRITNDELRTAVEGLGLAEVETFRASGNVVFAAAERSADDLQALLEEGLAEVLGYEVPTFVRSAAELQKVTRADPFSGAEGKLQVALLHDRPAAKAARELPGLAPEGEQLALDGRELYWLPAAGISDSPIDWKAVERLVGPTTVRTIGTIGQIAARWFA